MRGRDPTAGGGNQVIRYPRIVAACWREARWDWPRRRRSRKPARRGRCLVAGIGRAGRLDKQEMHLLPRDWAMLDALRHDAHLAGSERDGPISQLDVEPALEHQEEI